MIVWRTLPADRFFRATPLAVQLVDDFTGAMAFEPVVLELWAQGDDGTFRRSPFLPVRSPSGFVTFPGLGRRNGAAGRPPAVHRLLARSTQYRALYGPFPAAETGLEFPVPLYDDATPPAPVPFTPMPLPMLPSAAYPFPPEIPVLRGRLRDAAGRPVVGARVAEGARERVLSDERGAFALPLRWVPLGSTATIDITTRGGVVPPPVTVSVPDDLGVEKLITIP